VHLVVNNAGVSVTGTLGAAAGGLRWIVGVNFWGVVHGCSSSCPRCAAARRRPKRTS
jgi:NAD(P)-dependent dehydrogenase (short-subunit alcohol dehydrogenase family)